MDREEVKDEIEFALEQAEMGLHYSPPCKVMAELCRVWLAVDAAPVAGEVSWREGDGTWTIRNGRWVHTPDAALPAALRATP